MIARLVIANNLHYFLIFSNSIYKVKIARCEEYEINENNQGFYL